MRRSVRLLRRVSLCAAMLLSLSILVQGGALAQQSGDEQKCTNAMNKDLQKVAATQAKEINGCIKNFAKGKETDLVACLTADAKGKVAKATGKTTGNFTKKCGTVPTWGVTDPDTVNSTAIRKELDLIRSVMGWELEGVKRELVDKDGAKCQGSVIKAMFKCQDASMKAFNGCKKGGLKDGSITDTATLGACKGDDPKGKISKACGKVGDTIAKKCAGMDLADLFPGCNASDAGALETCLNEAAACQACLAIQRADGIPDGPDCGSCVLTPAGPIGSHLGVLNPLDPNGFPPAFCDSGPSEGEFCTDTKSGEDCPNPPLPDPPARCFANSAGAFNTAAAQPQLTFALTGGLDISCDPNVVPDPVTGDGRIPCRCDVLSLTGQDLEPIGWVCFGTHTDCPTGEIDCDGGTPMDLDQIGEHGIGFCGLIDPNAANEECASQCETYCTGLGPGYEMIDSGCEGYCQEGLNDGEPCSFDLDCDEGACAGGDPPAHGNNCLCSCAARAGDPSPPGAMHCSAGIQIIVEYNAPCESVDSINDTFILLPTICVPLTTETANGKIISSNFGGADIVGYEWEGVRGSCPDLATSVTTGTKMVGNISIFDSSIGDLQVQAVVSME